LDARELYADLEPITFEKFLDELIAGKIKKLYSETSVRQMLDGKKE
jgi:hypothetical protein